MSKYGAKKVTIDGIVFDSKIEGQYYVYLKELVLREEIQAFEIQPSYELIKGFKANNGKSYRPITYKADFLIEHWDGSIEVVDIKGMELEVFKIKEKLFRYFYPDIKLNILTFSKIDGGWISLDDLKKARKERQKAKMKKQVVKDGSKYVLSNK